MAASSAENEREEEETWRELVQLHDGESLFSPISNSTRIKVARASDLCTDTPINTDISMPISNWVTRFSFLSLFLCIVYLYSSISYPCDFRC